MIMKPIALVFAATLALTACNEETATACTAETAQAKMADLTATMTTLGTSDPAKLEQFSGRVAELQTRFADTSTDPQAACAAIDALMAEMQ